jgi:hypothetical protein
LEEILAALEMDYEEVNKDEEEYAEAVEEG